jgi:hypothetical protein
MRQTIPDGRQTHGALHLGTHAGSLATRVEPSTRTTPTVLTPIPAPTDHDWSEEIRQRHQSLDYLAGHRSG